MTGIPRIALFADTFHEVNGAARTCREWEAFAHRSGAPFFCIRWGGEASFCDQDPVWSMEFVRTRWSFPVDTDLRFDPFFYRALRQVEAQLRRFDPDFIHITSPGDLGILGAIVAARLNIPLGLSWHTNVHEFAGRRIAGAISCMPRRVSSWAADAVERFIMDRLVWFFGRGQLLFAPNEELRALLESRTGKPVQRMGRGIDTNLFHPNQRVRQDSDLVLGFVGRLMPEKGLRLLPRVAAELNRSSVGPFRFRITGAGSERGWLERNLPGAEFTGVLKGEDLARSYAGMDVFVFPSRTDTFGNVLQEAMASGVPAVVMDSGGPRFIVQHGSTGLVSSSDEEFCQNVALLAGHKALREKMSGAARRQVEGRSWNTVFEEVLGGYGCCPVQRI